MHGDRTFIPRDVHEQCWHLDQRLKSQVTQVRVPPRDTRRWETLQNPVVWTLGNKENEHAAETYVFTPLLLSPSSKPLFHIFSLISLVYFILFIHYFFITQKKLEFCFPIICFFLHCLFTIFLSLLHLSYLVFLYCALNSKATFLSYLP